MNHQMNNVKSYNAVGSTSRSPPILKNQSRRLLSNRAKLESRFLVSRAHPVGSGCQVVSTHPEPAVDHEDAGFRLNDRIVALPQIAYDIFD